MVRVAVSTLPALSVTRTANVPVPASPASGRPVRLPSGATTSHDGPLSFANTLPPPPGVQLVASDPGYGSPGTAVGNVSVSAANCSTAPPAMAATSASPSA